MTVAGLAKSRGVGVKEINFVPTAGGGESMNLLLSGAATVGVDTVAELRPQIEAGELRVLAVDSEKRVTGIDAPTMKELGLAGEAVSTLAGVLAPAGLSKEQQQDVIGLLDRVRQSSCWKKVLERNNWTEDWKPGEEFGKVLTEQRTQSPPSWASWGSARDAADRLARLPGGGPGGAGAGVLDPAGRRLPGGGAARVPAAGGGGAGRGVGDRGRPGVQVRPVARGRDPHTKRRTGLLC